MVERWYKKGLVIGIIVLFVGVGVNPAFAVETESSTNNMESEEDCDCQTVSDINLMKVKSALNRLKVYTRILSKLSKLNPAFAVETESIIDFIENEEDCESQTISDINLVKLKSMLNKLKIYTTTLSQSSKLNPKLQEQ